MSLAGRGRTVPGRLLGRRIAQSVGFPAARIVLHGNVKTGEDLNAALSYRVGRIVLDSFDEINRLAALVTTDQEVLVRVTPGVAAGTHHSITTGAAERRVLTTRGLRFAGLHCHIGSQVRRIAAYEEAARKMVGLIASLRVRVRQLDLGGGFAVPYLPCEPEFDIPGLAHRLR